jgi:hypothetical protein
LAVSLNPRIADSDSDDVGEPRSGRPDPASD